MNYTVIEVNEVLLLEMTAGHEVISREGDALELVAACMEHGCSKVMMDAACLSEEFFRLRTGLAGAVIQKLNNYQIQAAVVAPPGAAGQGKFRDFMLETNRGNQFRIFEDRAEALSWLLGA